MSKVISILLMVFIPQISFAKLKCPSKKIQSSYDMIIIASARKHKVDPALVHAVIKQESCYNKLAVSHAGAEGLMQLIPATAKRFNVKNAFIPKQNIDAGTKYLAWLLKRFNGNIKFALAGYNAGEGRVDQYKGIPPFRETRKYVKVVMANYRGFKGLPRYPSKSNKKKTFNRSILVEISKKKINSISRKALTKKHNKPFMAKIKKRNTGESIIFGSRHRIRSMTLAKLDTPRIGYSRIRAKSKRFLQ